MRWRVPHRTRERRAGWLENGRCDRCPRSCRQAGCDSQATLLGSRSLRTQSVSLSVKAALERASEWELPRVHKVSRAGWEPLRRTPAAYFSYHLSGGLLSNWVSSISLIYKRVECSVKVNPCVLGTTFIGALCVAPPPDELYIQKCLKLPKSYENTIGLLNQWLIKFCIDNY